MGLKAECQNSDHGCEWTGELSDLLKVNMQFCRTFCVTLKSGVTLY